MNKTVSIQEAIEILNNYRNYPRDSIEMCKSLGVRVMVTPDFPNEVLGVTYKSKEEQKYIILVNERLSPERKNFFIVHCLGHYLMHKEIIENHDEICCGCKGYDTKSSVFSAEKNLSHWERETEANAFAEEVLMPAKHFEAACIDIDNLEAIAEHFRVPLSAAALRAYKLSGIYFL